MFWIVRVLRAKWYTPDYIGCYLANTAAQALTVAGADPYMAKVMNRKVIAVEAVVADGLELQNARAVRPIGGVY